MPGERDLFANFERMRREMDELFGDVFDRTGFAPAKRVKGKIGYFRARLIFQGLPKGPITVKIVGKTTQGKTVNLQRRYKLCTKKGR